MKFLTLALVAALGGSASAFTVAPKTNNVNTALFSSSYEVDVGAPGVEAPGERGGEMSLTKDVWESLSPIKVQGGSLRRQPSEGMLRRADARARMKMLAKNFGVKCRMRLLI